MCTFFLSIRGGNYKILILCLFTSFSQFKQQWSLDAFFFNITYNFMYYQKN